MDKKKRIAELLNKKENGGLTPAELSEFSSYQNHPEETNAYWFTNTAVPSIARGLEENNSALIPTLPILKDLVQGKSVPQAVGNVGKRFVDTLAGVGRTALGAADIATNLVMGTTPSGNEQDIANRTMAETAVEPVVSPIQSFKKDPYRTVATDLPLLLAGLSGLKSLKTPSTERLSFPGIASKEKVVVPTLEENLKKIQIPNEEIEGTWHNLRNPADIGTMGNEAYKIAVKKLHTAMGDTLKGIEEAQPNRVANIDAYIAEVKANPDPTVQLRIKQSPMLRAAVALSEEGKPVNLKLSQLQQMKNEITGKISKSKFEPGSKKSTDLGQMEMVMDLNKEILGNFEEMKPLYQEYAPRANALYNARAMRTPAGAYSFITGETNPVRLEAAASQFDEPSRVAIKKIVRARNFSIPETSPILPGFGLKSLARNPWGKPRNK